MELEFKGVDVRRNQPEGGVIGLAGYLASLGPCKGVSSACMIATTFGKSIDAMAAERMRKNLEKWFDLEFKIPDSATDKLIQKMEQLLGLEMDKEESFNYLRVNFVYVTYCSMLFVHRYKNVYNL